VKYADNLLVLGVADGRSGQTTSAAGSNLSSLGTSRHISTTSTGLAHVLLVSTTVRVINRVHGNTGDCRPGVTLDAELVPRTTSLKHRLVSASTTGDQTNHSSALVGECLLGAGRKSNTCYAAVRVLRDNDGVFAGSTCHLTAITNLGLNVADGGTLGQLGDGADVTDGKTSLKTVVDELSGVHSLACGDENIFLSVVICVLVLHLG